MGGEWCLEAKSYARLFTREDQRKWKKARNVLQEIATYRQFRVATKPEEEDHGYETKTACEKCSKRSGIFKVWHPVRYGGIEVPLCLHGVGRVCTCNDSCRKWGRKFQVFGCVKWKTSSFCEDLEAVMAFLFPGMFEVEWDTFNADRDDAVVTYTLCDEDGAGLDTRLPVEFATRIRAIKNHVPTLSNLCVDQIERAYGRDAATAAIIDLGM
jgi:hypothetical protein